MGKTAGGLLATLLVLTAAFGVGLGVYILLAESVVMLPFGLPVEVRGADKLLLGIFCFAPAVTLGGLAWSRWQDRRANPGAAPDRSAGPGR